MSFRPSQGRKDGGIDVIFRMRRVRSMKAITAMNVEPDGRLLIGDGSNFIEVPVAAIRPFIEALEMYCGPESSCEGFYVIETGEVGKL
jgi:hypothetical protein